MTGGGKVCAIDSAGSAREAAGNGCNARYVGRGRAGMIAAVLLSKTPGVLRCATPARPLVRRAPVPARRRLGSVIVLTYPLLTLTYILARGFTDGERPIATVP